MSLRKLNGVPLNKSCSTAHRRILISSKWEKDRSLLHTNAAEMMLTLGTYKDELTIFLPSYT